MELAMTLLGFLVPVLILIMGWGLMKKPPKDRMGMVGYRTTRSRSSQAAWEFANKLAGKYWVIEGLLLFPISALALWLLHGSMSAEGYVLAVSALLLVQALFICIPIPLVERALKERYENGIHKQ